jgi:Predicted membrane protein
MQYLGESIAVCVAVSWTFTALFFEFAGKRIGSLSVNILRLVSAFFLLGGLLYFMTGSFLPTYTDGKSWLWMSLSGLVGFVFGDLCLFYSYMIITARFSQLLMTLAPPFAALFGWMLLSERLTPMAFLGMTVTLVGIAISILKKGKSDTLAAGTSNMTVITSVGGSKEEIGSGGAGESGKNGVVAEEDSEITISDKNSIAVGRKSLVGKLMPDLELNLPIKGILLGIGGALGQGLGIVLSKQGMNYYSIAAEGSEVAGYIPFAATQMRIITGIIGFALIIALTKNGKALRASFKDKKALSAVFGGSVFGPFIGVSLSLMAVQHTNTAIASTIMATTPILIIIPYVLFYKKKVTTIEVVGAVLSVVGVSLFFL